MSEWVLTLQAVPEYQLGYNKPYESNMYAHGKERDAFDLGQRDWKSDNEPRTTNHEPRNEE